MSATNNESKKRAGNTSDEQKNALAEYMKCNKQLVTGKFSQQFTFKDAQKLWSGLADKLNSIPGGQKDWKQWRKVWQDMRCRTKAKAAKEKQRLLKTGGGESPEIIFSPYEEEVITLIGNTAIEGHNNVEESIITLEVFDDIAVPSTSPIPSTSGVVSATVVTPKVLYQEPSPVREVIDERDENKVERVAASASKHVKSVQQKRRVASQRFENTLTICNEFVKLHEEKNKTEQQFQKELLQLKRRKIEALERIAAAIEKLT